MNVFELFTFLSIAGGALYGGSIGFSLFGVLGVIIGVPIAGAVGYGVEVASLFLFACLMSVVTGDPLFKPRDRP